MVTSPDFIDPHKFGVIVVANFGLVANVFSNETDLRRADGRRLRKPCGST